MDEAASFWVGWFWFSYVAFVLIFAWVGYLVGRTKGRARLGGWLGFLLGPFGVLAVGLMEPTQDVLKRRAGGQAAGGAEDFATASGPESVTAAPGFVVTPQVRQELLAEAIRRDPSLAGVSDPDGFKRLGESMANLEEEYRLKHELQQMRSAQAAAAVQERRARELAEQQARSEAELRRRAQEDRLGREAAAAAERDRLAAMNPLARWFTNHRPVWVTSLALAVVLVVAASVYLASPSGTGSTPAAANPGQSDQTTSPTSESPNVSSAPSGPWMAGFSGAYIESPVENDGSVLAESTPDSYVWEVRTDCSPSDCTSSAETWSAVARYRDPMIVKPRFHGNGFSSRTVGTSKCNDGGSRKYVITRTYTAKTVDAGWVVEFTGTYHIKTLKRCPEDVKGMYDGSLGAVLRRAS